MVIAEAKAPSTVAAETSATSLEFMAATGNWNVAVEAKSKGIQPPKIEISKIVAGTLIIIMLIRAKIVPTNPKPNKEITVIFKQKNDGKIMLIFYSKVIKLTVKNICHVIISLT